MAAAARRPVHQPAPGQALPERGDVAQGQGPEHIDFVVVRENSGGIYTGIGGVTQKGTPLEDVEAQHPTEARPVRERSALP